MSQKQTQEIVAQSIDDLGSVTIYETVRRPDGVRVKVGMRALSEQEAFDLRRKVKWPRPPILQMRKDASPLYDFQNEDYLLAVDEANHKLALMTLAATLCLPLSGNTEEEKAATLEKTLGRYAFNTLLTKAQKINFVSEEDVAEAALSFRDDGDIVAPDNGRTRADAEPVAGAPQE